MRFHQYFTTHLLAVEHCSDKFEEACFDFNDNDELDIVLLLFNTWVLGDDGIAFVCLLPLWTAFCKALG